MADQNSGASPPGGALSSLWASLPASFLDRALSSLNALGSLWIFFIMALVNADVIGRNLFFAPIDGVNEIIELSLIGIVFLQLGDATRHGRLTRSDGFFNFMVRRKPKIGQKMGVIFDLLGAFFMGLILWGAMPLLIESWEGDFYEGQEGVFTAPVWPVNLVIVIGCFLTFLLFLRMAWRYWHGVHPHTGEPMEGAKP